MHHEETESKNDINLSHLDYLGHDVDHPDGTIRMIYLYCEAPDYVRLGDPNEGISCVDDVARAAIVYLHHFEYFRDDHSLENARRLLRFILYMQDENNGLFYNFVVNTDLEINREHFRSAAITLDWWTCRAVWALGTAIRILDDVDPDFTARCGAAISKTIPNVRLLLTSYPETQNHRGRIAPTWLVKGDGADATSELMLGLVALNQARPSSELQMLIARLAEGLAIMRYGSMTEFPYGLHASNATAWHKWGNSQTQALAEAGFLASAKLEADIFYPRLLIEGYLHSISFDDLHAVEYYERIAYGIRSVAVGLLRLHEILGDPRYAEMAGLAATWLTGNNGLNTPMYEPETGRCFDGILDTDELNPNSGAESTIETLFTLLELNRNNLARRWMHANGNVSRRAELDGSEFLFRVFEAETEEGTRKIAPVIDITHETSQMAAGQWLEDLMASTSEEIDSLPKKS